MTSSVLDQLEQTVSAAETAVTDSASRSKLADPGPLGLAAFAGTTFVLSFFNAGILDASLVAVVLPLALFYGGLTQFVAGLFEFRRGNTFGTLGFTSYGAFWMAFAAYVWFIVPTLPADSAHTAEGMFLVIWAIFTLYMAVVTVRISVGLMWVFFPLAATFLFLAIGALSGTEWITHVGGFIGLFTALTAWYNSFAGVLNTTWKRTVLPLGERA